MCKFTKRVISTLMVIAFVAGLCMNNVHAATVYKVNVPVTYGQTTGRTILDMINKFRTGKDAWYWNSDNKTKTVCSGLPKLTYDYDLEQIAMQRAAEIAIYYSHTRPDGSAFNSGYHTWMASGENIALGFTSAASVFDAWVEANEKYQGQPHRRNMLNNHFGAVAIGHCYYNGYECWVQEFIDKPVSSTKTTANDKLTTKTVSLLSTNIIKQNLSIASTSVSVGVGSSLTPPVISGKITTTETVQGLDCQISVPCTWTSENTSIAKIAEGKIVGVKAGTTTITTTALGKKFSVSVKVTSSGSSTNIFVPTPTSFSVGTRGLTSLALKWTTSEKVTGYELQRKKTVNGTLQWSSLASTTETSYTVSGLSAGTLYYLRLRAYKTVSGKKYYSEWKNLTTCTKPSAPSTFTVKTRNTTSLELQWAAVSKATSYQLQYKDGSTWKDVTKTTAKTYKINGLSNGTTYSFRVRAIRELDNGNKYYSDWKTITTSTKPVAPTIATPTTSSKKITAKWVKVTNCTSYEVQLSTKNDFSKDLKSAKVQGNSTLSYTFSSLKTGTTYYIRVRAIRTLSNGNSYTSGWSAVKSIKCK